MPGTVAITGAYGYIGSLIRSRLDAAGWRTVAFVRSPRRDDDAVPWSLSDGAPVQALRDADALIHCAYDFRPRKRDDIWRVNVLGSAALMHAASEAGIARMIAVSSMSAYQGTSQLYGLAKLALEDTTLALGGVAVRPGVVYGPAPGGIAGALLKVSRLPVVPVLGGPTRLFAVHQDDLADAIVEIIEVPAWTPAVIGIAQPTAVSFPEFLRALAGQQGRRPRFVPVPWRGVYWGLRCAELVTGALPLRSDSVLGLVRPARDVPQSTAFPQLLDGLRSLT